VTDIAGDDVDLDAGVEFLDLGGGGFSALGVLAWGENNGQAHPTFLPMSASLMKNCAPRSSSVTTSWSARVMEPMPAKTRFFAISLASALMETRRMLAVRILYASVAAEKMRRRVLLLLGLHAPEADLPVIKCDFIWRCRLIAVQPHEQYSYLRRSCRLRQRPSQCFLPHRRWGRCH
jgi:hypothetical protein